MNEDTIWKGTSSQWKNCGAFTLLIASVPVSVALHLWLRDKGVGLWIYLLVLVAALWALWKWAQLKTTVFQLTNERLITTSGIFTKVTNMLELYRVRDLKTVQPLWLRLLGLQNIEIYTSDASTAGVNLEYVQASLNLQDRLRQCVEACRLRKNVRTMDIVDGKPGDALIDDETHQS
jgi:uncharacterized membrane protein YdbT with pleckstrin-like domain